MQPIWKLLQDLKTGTPGKLDCEECYALLEHLADLAVDGVDEVVLMNAVEAHFRICPQCETHHLERIDTEQKRIQNLPDSYTPGREL